MPYAWTGDFLVPRGGDDLMWRGLDELMARDLCLGDLVASHLKRAWSKGIAMDLAAQSHARNPRPAVAHPQDGLLRFQNTPGRMRGAVTQGLPRCILSRTKAQRAARPLSPRSA